MPWVVFVLAFFITAAAGLQITFHPGIAGAINNVSVEAHVYQGSKIGDPIPHRRTFIRLRHPLNAFLINFEGSTMFVPSGALTAWDPYAISHDQDIGVITIQTNGASHITGPTMLSFNLTNVRVEEICYPMGAFTFIVETEEICKRVFSSTSTPTITVIPTLSDTTTPTRSSTRTGTTTSTLTDSGTQSPSASRSVTSTDSETATPSASTTATSSATVVPTSTGTSTSSASSTGTMTVVPTVTPTFSQSSTATATSTSTTSFSTTFSRTATLTSSPTASPTRSSTGTPTSTSSATASSTSTSTTTRTHTATSTDTATDSSTATSSSTASLTASPTATSSTTASSTYTPSPTPTASFSTKTESVTLTATCTTTLTRPVTTTPTPTHSRTKTSTSSATATDTPSDTSSSTPTSTSSASATVTSTSTHSESDTTTRSATPTTTMSPTRTVTNTQQPTLSPTATPTATATSSDTATATVTATATSSDTSTTSQSESITFSPTGTMSITPSNISETPTSSPTMIPTHTSTATSTATATGTKTQSATRTASPSQTASRTGTSTETSTNSRTATGTRSSTSTNTFTTSTSATPTPTRSVTGTSSETDTSTSTSTATVVPTQTPTVTDSATSTVTYSSTGSTTISGSYTTTMTASPSVTATDSSTPTPTATETSSSTSTGTSTLTVIPTKTATPTATTTVTMTATSTFTPTGTSSMTLTATPTTTFTCSATPSQTASPTPTPTPSATATATATSTFLPTRTTTSSRTLTSSSTPTATVIPSQTPTSTSTSTTTVSDDGITGKCIVETGYPSLPQEWCVYAPEIFTAPTRNFWDKDSGALLGTLGISTINVSDRALALEDEMVTIGAVHGILSFYNKDGGVITVSNDPPHNFSFVGPIPKIDNILANMVYTPKPTHAASVDQIVVIADDMDPRPGKRSVSTWSMTISMNGYGLGELTSSAVVPPIPEIQERRGFYHFKIDQATGELEVYLTAHNLSGMPTSVTLHCDAADSVMPCTPDHTCPICVHLSHLIRSASLPLKVTVIVPVAIRHQIQKGNAYFLISTTAYPNGELRGYGQGVGAIDDNTLYNTSTLYTASPIYSLDDCAMLCREDWDCVTYSWARINYCLLKSAPRGEVVHTPNFVSGVAPEPVYFYFNNLWWAHLSSTTCPYRALVLMTPVQGATGTCRVHMVHTIPESHLSPLAQLEMQNSFSSTNPWVGVMGVAGTGHILLAMVQLSPEMEDALNKFRLTMRILTTTGDSVKGIVYPTTLEPILKLPEQDTIAAALFPSHRRGTDSAAITIAVNFSRINVGNELWITIPRGFRFNSFGTSSVVYPIGVLEAPEVVIDEEAHVVQLRWTKLPQIPFENDTFVAFTLNYIGLPNNCDQQEYRIQTASCWMEDLWNAGVLFYRKCRPNQANTINMNLIGTPAGGSPIGCRSDGCNSCKYLYTAPGTDDAIFECQHNAITYHRVNVTDCLFCGIPVNPLGITN